MGTLRKNKLLFFIIAISNFATALCVALQAPFFPKVAESRGLSPREYGMIFSVHFLSQFLVSPVLGKKISAIGSKRMLVVGALITGLSCICFGLAILFNSRINFIIWCIVFRITEAFGISAIMTSVYSIIGYLFQEEIGLACTLMESSFALGLIIGPVVGGLLYDAGGYIVPFAVMGSCLVIASILVAYILKHTIEETDVDHSNVFVALKIPEVLLSLFSVFVAMNTYGFISANLEPHVRHLNLSSTMLGTLFLLMGFTQSITTPISGKMYDTGISSHLLVIGSCIIELIVFMLIGPLSIFRFKVSYLSVALLLAVHGLGFGTQLIIALASGQKYAIRAGLPDNMSTFGLISGLWTSSFALGAFIGPVVTAEIREQYDFNSASYYPLSLNLLLLLLHYVFMMKNYITEPLTFEKNNISATISIEKSFVSNSISKSLNGEENGLKEYGGVDNEGFNSNL